MIERRPEQFSFTAGGYGWQHPKRAGWVISKAKNTTVSFKERIELRVPFLSICFG